MYPSLLASARLSAREARHHGKCEPRCLKASFSSALLRRRSPFLSYFRKMPLICSSVSSTVILPLGTTAHILGCLETLVLQSLALHFQHGNDRVYIELLSYSVFRFHLNYIRPHHPTLRDKPGQAK